jgi:hypothetical protein
MTCRWGNGNTLDAIGDEVDQVAFPVSLSQGWNMIGNPFRYEVALSQLQVNYGATTEYLQDAEDSGWVI